MPLKPTRSIVLIACAAAIFWPGAFIFGFPGVLRQHWQQVFAAGGGSVGGTVSFMLAGATCFILILTRWGVDALTSSAGWVALIVGVVASSMIRFPETETPGATSPLSSGPHGRRVADALASLVR
jgi:OFA family oxalate/formate antiporter-like MFS transporter